MSQPVSSNPIRQYYDDWSNRTPYVTRSVMIGIVVIYISSFFFHANLILGNITFYTILQLQIYRIALSPLVGNSILDLIIIALFFPVMGGRLEYSMGSASFVFLLGLLTISINIAFNLFCMAMYYAGVMLALYWPCSGFWTVLFSLITVECMQVRPSLYINPLHLSF